MRISDIVEEKLRSKIESLNLEEYFEFDLKEYLINELKNNQFREQIYRNIWNNRLEVNKIIYNDVEFFVDQHDCKIMNQPVFHNETPSIHDLIHRDIISYFYKNTGYLEIGLSKMEIDKPAFFILIRKKCKLLRLFPFNTRDLLEFHIYLP